MATLTNYKGLEVVDPDPSGAGGLAIQDDLKKLVDWQIVAALDKDLSAPPGSPTLGDRYIVGPSPTGDWSGHADDFAEYDGSTWQFTAPQTNQPSYVIDETRLYEWDGTAWGPLSGSPAGSDTQVQFNDGGDFGGSSGLTYDKTGTALSIDNLQLDGNTLSSTDTNGSVVITPNGTGAIQTDTSGNARGNQAVDFQGSRVVATQVASGDYSFIAGGQNNTASGDFSHAEGNLTTVTGNYSHTQGGFFASASGDYAHAEGSVTSATANYSHAGGVASWAGLHAQWARASGTWGFLASGKAQTTISQLMRETSDASAQELTLGGGTPTSSNRFVLRDGQTLSCFINIVGRKENGGANDHASFLRQVLIRREGTTTQLVGAVQTIGADINPAGWGGVTITADDTNESLKVDVTGAASTDIRWMATVMASEVADP